jgi:hypothetical protein
MMARRKCTKMLNHNEIALNNEKNHRQPNSIESGLHFIAIILLTRTQKSDKVCFQGHKNVFRKENKGLCKIKQYFQKIFYLWQ